MNASDAEGDEANDGIMPLRVRHTYRRDQSTVDASDEEQQGQTVPSLSVPQGRATRFLSISEPSAQLPSASLSKLWRMGRQLVNVQNAFALDQISDDLLSKIPFQ